MNVGKEISTMLKVNLNHVYVRRGLTELVAYDDEEETDDMQDMAD